MKELTVLSTACCAMFMPGFFSCLKENNERIIKIIGVDIRESPILPSGLDKYIKVPSYKDPNYIDSLLDICSQEKVDIFFPQISMELPLVLNNIEKFHDLGVKVSITNNKTLLTANNKYKLYETLRNNNIPTPKYRKFSSISNLDNDVELLGYPLKPVCIKLTESSGSRGVRIITDTYSKLDAFLYEKPSSLRCTLEDIKSILSESKNIPELMLMEYLPGCEYTVDLLADHGKTIYIAGRRNYESNFSIAMASYTEKIQSAYETCKKIVSLLQLDGNIGFDFLFNSEGIPILTDLNPRITATIVLYKKAGLNLPYLRVKQLLNEPLPEIDLAYGVNMRRYFHDQF